MYSLDEYRYINPEPWLITLENRIDTLIKSKESGYNTVVYVYELPDSSTFRYRGYNMCQSLDLSLQWRGVYFFVAELEKLHEYIDNIDVVIIVRCRATSKIVEFIDKLKSNNIPILFDVDDMVYDEKYTDTLVEAVSTIQNDFVKKFWGDYIKGIEETMSLCQGFVTTNQFLADKIAEDTGMKGYVIPNYMNWQQLNSSEFYYKQKKKKKGDESIVIGYFSGSPTHFDDFCQASTALERLLEENQNVKVLLAGHMEMPTNLKKFKKEERVVYIPFQNFVKLQKYVAQVDINIIPLVYSDFTNCKSELKYFEAAVTGVISCATPTYVYEHCIVDGVNGYLCNSEEEWYDKLNKVIRMSDSERTKIIEKARTDVIERYAYYNQVNLIDGMLNDIISKR